MADFDRAVAQQFLEAVLGRVPAGLFGLLWQMPGRVSVWTPDTGQALKWAGDATKQKANAYCGVALCHEDRGAHQRTTNEHSAGLLGLVADVDFAAKAGAKKKYPPDVAAASAVIHATGLTPTLIVHSGNGLQAWWLFREPWVFADDAERQAAIGLSAAWGKQLHTEANRAGYEVDSVHDLARVLRVAGTANWKDPDNPKPVQIIWHNDEQRYVPEDFRQQLAAVADLASLEAAAPAPARAAPTPSASPAPAPVALDDKVLKLKHESLLEVPDYAAAWNRQGAIKDNSPSGWDMKFANLLVVAGMTDPEIVAMLHAYRRKYGDPLKHGGYYNLTLAKAHEAHPHVQPISGSDPALVADEPPKSREEQVAEIAALLCIPLVNLQRITGTDPVYRFTFVGGLVGELLAVHIPVQRTTRHQLFATTGILPRFIEKKESPGWDEIAMRMARAAEVVDAGEDATATGELRAVLEGYFALHHAPTLERGTLVERADAPFIRDGQVWFQGMRVVAWAGQALGVKLTVQVLKQRLTALGAAHKHHAVRKGEGKTTVRFCGLPVEVVGLGAASEPDAATEEGSQPR